MLIQKFGTNVLSIESFFTYLDREFFTPHFGELEYFTVFTDDGFKMIVLAFYFAFVLAAAVIYYNRVIIGSLPRALGKNECHSPETAKSIADLGLKKNIFVMFSLWRGNTLRRIVRCVEGEKWEKNEARMPTKSKFLEFILPEKRYKIDFEKDRFYIPEERKYVAEIKFAKKGNGVLSLILTAVIGIVVVFLIFKFVPGLIEMLDNAIGAALAE